MKGSMTVEAVFVTSLLLMVILWSLKIAVGLYQQSADLAAVNWLDAQEAVSRFRNLFVIKEIMP